MFGRAKHNQEAGMKKDMIELMGEKIAGHHFEIDYDKVSGTIILRNLNFDTNKSCGLYKMMFANENYNILPGDAFRIGSLEFLTERFNTGIVSDIGQRDYMEDAHQYIHQLINLDNKVQVTYYAVFDGHGGDVCAKFCSANLHLEIKYQLEDVLNGIENSDDLNKTIQDCLCRAFQIADEKYKNNYPTESKQCGSTANVALIIGNKLYCASVGDARAILCRNKKALDLSVDHKVSRKDEMHRIKSQGGYIFRGRVLGRLAITRAFGDYDSKNIETNVEPNEDGTMPDGP